MSVLLIDKPAGWTSHDVVAKVRVHLRSLEGKKVKVGHSGTLDPFATGLLIVLTEKDTKRADEFLKLDKTYEVTAQLGAKSTTGDPEGEITPVSSLEPAAKDVKTALKSFLGEIMQTPPAYSAIKVNGKRAYQLARAGKNVKLEPRKVKIHKLEATRYEYPKLSFRATVSSGTYIRSLVEDLGQALGTGAYTIELRRLSVGNFSVENAIRPEGLNSKLTSDTIVDR